jgi:transcriptional regulator of arginine metabolism
MNRERQQAILEIISRRRVANQQELVAELQQSGIRTTQSSVSRDVTKLGLVKLNGSYAVTAPEALSAGPIVSIDTAGDCLIVVKTEIGQASPTALKIDQAGIDQIVGTVAGDDTMLIAVKNAASQRVAIKKILELFSAPEPRVRVVGRTSAAADKSGVGIKTEGMGSNG